MRGINRSRINNEINASSMADIAFLLLIFFLVTTTIYNDQGIFIKLPAYEPATPLTPIPKKNVLTVRLNGANELFVEENIAATSELRAITKNFIMNPSHSDDKPNAPTKAVISLHHDRSTEYNSYLQVYNELKGAYAELWNEKALKDFSQPYRQLTKKQQQSIRKKIPLVISEAEPTDFFANK